MTLLEIWLLGLALAIDCLTVSIATGVANRRWIPRPMLCMALSFGLFQGGMTLLGYLGTSLFSDYIRHFDHWIAFGLLLYLGGRMIYESFRENEEEAVVGQKMLTPRSILTLSVATSIDALAVGISFACIGNCPIATPVCVIGFCSTALSLSGLWLGITIGKRVNWHAEALGGLVLIGIGVKILIEHLSQ